MVIVSLVEDFGDGSDRPVPKIKNKVRTTRGTERSTLRSHRQRESAHPKVIRIVNTCIIKNL